MWKRGDKLELPAYMMFASRFRKAKGKNPLCYYLQLLRAEGRKITSPGAGCCVTRSRTCCILRKSSTSAVPGGVICVQHGPL